MVSDDDFGDLFSHNLGRRPRDEGIERILGHNTSWIVRCQEEAKRYMALVDECTGEDIRFHCERTVGYPGHPNAWGALTNSLVKKGIIKKTGKWAQSKDESSHATLIQVYERCH